MRFFLSVSAGILMALTSSAAAQKKREPIPYTTPVTLSEKLVSWVRKGVAARLKDPESARFGEMKGMSDNNGAIVVCGLVNAKNSFGGYTGMLPFNGLLSEISNGETKRPFLVLGIGGSELDTRVVLDVCLRHGIRL